MDVWIILQSYFLDAGGLYLEFDGAFFLFLWNIENLFVFIRNSSRVLFHFFELSLQKLPL